MQTQYEHRTNFAHDPWRRNEQQHGGHGDALHAAEPEHPTQMGAMSGSAETWSAYAQQSRAPYDSGVHPPTASERAYFGLDGIGGVGQQGASATAVPFAKESYLQGSAARQDVEVLLRATGFDASRRAALAVELVLELPETERGKVIDTLSSTAFDHLLERLDDQHLERLRVLADASLHPERKLRLWAAAHPARARANVARLKGDIGAPIPMTEVEYEDGREGEEFDNEAEQQIRQSLTPSQLRNRKRHFRRQAAAESTQTEVDDEVKVLMAKSKKGQLTLKDVDQLRERKDHEYQIELESNVNLTAEVPNETGNAAHWTQDDLLQVRRTLPRLPHAQAPDGVADLRRVTSRGPQVGGVYNRLTRSIDVTDIASGSSRLFPHDGDDRELVSDRFRKDHGETIGRMEFVLTHEIGHDVHAKHADAFAAFQKAAGYHRVNVEALRADGVDEAAIAALEALRSSSGGKMSDVKGRTHMYKADAASKDLFLALPITAIPAEGEAAPSSGGGDSWSYARSNPNEHFADLYAKAVHVPATLHDDLIVRPEAAAAKARADADEARRRLTVAETIREVYPDLLLAQLRLTAGIADSELTRRESASELRAGQFEVMRNTVFHTDRAVQTAIQRLQLMNVSAEKIRDFQERAAHVLTPEQVAHLEVEASR